MQSKQPFFRQHPLLIFFILVFIISWSAVYLLAGPDGFPVTEDRAVTLGMAILLGPSIAGIVSTGLFSGRSGFQDLRKRLFTWRVGGRWYATALLIAPLTTAAALALFSLFAANGVPAMLLSGQKTALVMGGIMGGLFVALFEELGWTGFAVPGLKQRRGILAAGGIIGLIWGGWHFPLFWELNSFTAFPPFILLLAKLFSWLPAYRVLMVWVYDHTESLLIAILMHMSLVATLMMLDPVLEGDELLIFISIRAILFWILAAVVHRR